MDGFKTFGRIVDEHGPAAVARQSCLSKAIVRLVCDRKYPASPEAVINVVLTAYGGKPMEKIPAGYKKDAQGRLVPVESIKEIDLTRDEIGAENSSKSSEGFRGVSRF